MPLYEFRCESCGHTMETILAFSDPLPTICETCGGALKKLLSAPAVQFKGSGFYLTDYGRSGAAGAKGRESGGDGESKPAGESKSGGEAKPAAETKAGGDAKPTAAASGSGTGGDAKPAG